MTTILSHPKRHKDLGKETFEFADGSVTICAPEGERLTLGGAIFLLEKTRAYILEMTEQT